MAATPGEVRDPRRRWLWTLPAFPVLGLAVASWWLTAPQTEKSRPSTSADAPAAPAPIPVESADPGWPEAAERGEPAKQRLLKVLLAARERFALYPGYTATFRKQERLAGVLGPEQTLAMKVRSRPFAIYLKFLTPKAGKEVVYAEGHRDNKVIAHNGDWTRRLIPRLAVAPTDPIALKDSRHPVTEAGLAALLDRLIFFRRLDLQDDGAESVLDRVVDDQGRTWLRSIHTHARRVSDRPFARVEVWYDPERRLPERIFSYDWPAPDHQGDLQLAERYAYDSLKLGAALTDRDFDPANPEYAFSRY